MDARKERKDSALRRRLWRALAATAALGLLALLGFDAWLRHVEAAPDPESSLRQISIAGVVLQLAMVTVAVLLARSLFDWARQVREQRQWPPAGLEWPGSAPVRHGAEALAIARRLRVAGAACMVVALLLALATGWRWLA